MRNEYATRHEIMEIALRHERLTIAGASALADEALD
jgi:hypothetical protein